MGLATDIADAVVAELAAGVAGEESFDVAFEPARKVVPLFNSEDLETLQVTVVPGAIATIISTRAYSQHDVRVDVGVQKHVDEMEEEVAGLGELVDAIRVFLDRRPLGAMKNAHWVSTTNDPLYSSDHLLERRIFTSVLHVTYRVMQ